MKFQCLGCGAVAVSTEWIETTFYCAECDDDHEGALCPTAGCGSIEGPGRTGYKEVKP